jgi:DNA-binding CsgD family transcriptional regulator
MGEDTSQAPRGESAGFDQLLLALYRGLDAAAPWREFLELLCGALGGCTATLVLRQPARGDRGELFDVGAREALVEVYRTANFPDDPFLDLEDGTVANIYDRVPREAFLRTRFYNELLKLDGNNDILALNVGFGDAYVGSLKISRREPSPLFGLAEKSLMMRLYPHLKTALELYERDHRRRLENRAYIKAIDQLAFGVVILNERGHVIRVNETAARLLDSGGPLRRVGSSLAATLPADEKRLGAAIRAGAAGSLKLAGGGPERPLYLLLKPIQEAAGEPATGLALFLSAERLQRNVAIDAFATLYGISRAEMALVTALLDGASIVEAAGELGISEHTARAQLRSIFGKTGTHRQTDLIRLVLTSLAIIA